MNILITGASSGIGQALAEKYAKPGINLFLSGRNQQALATIAHTCETQGASVNTALIDVTDAEKLKHWILACDDQSPLDLVIANAGISNAGKAFSYEKNQTIFDVNLQGVLNTIHPILPRMQARKQGQVAIMSSMASFRGLAKSPAYSASKAAVRVYGDALGALLEKQGVTVSVICPGFITTPLTDRNDFHMPFLMTTDKASDLIIKKLAEKKPMIDFPLRMRCLTWLLAAMPTRWVRWLTRRFWQ